ncbi:MAG TPA: aminotransferase class IV [Spirochaetota bacterium]|nr:aminotransferase class IV [Spirochaetota bacterium]
MSRLVESLKIENGVAANLAYHNARMNRTRRALFGCADDIDIADVLRGRAVPSAPVCKCRVLYREAVEEVDIKPYSRKRVESLKIVECDDIDYVWKYEDKSAFEELLLRKDDCDDVLIVKQGLITDTSFSNIALFDGSRWYTPARPLLRGTKREMLLEQCALTERDIAPGDLRNFQKASLINAMMELGELEIVAARIVP